MAAETCVLPLWRLRHRLILMPAQCPVCSRPCGFNVPMLGEVTRIIAWEAPSLSLSKPARSRSCRCSSQFLLSLPSSWELQCCPAPLLYSRSSSLPVQLRLSRSKPRQSYHQCRSSRLSHIQSMPRQHIVPPRRLCHGRVEVRAQGRSIYTSRDISANFEIQYSTLRFRR